MTWQYIYIYMILGNGLISLLRSQKYRKLFMGLTIMCREKYLPLMLLPACIGDGYVWRGSSQAHSLNRYHQIQHIYEMSTRPLYSIKTAKNNNERDHFISNNSQPSMHQ